MLTASSTDVDVDARVAGARSAQREFERWTEPRVDALLRDIAGCIADHAEELAAASVAETGYGNIADKVIKNRVASETVFRSLEGKAGTGLLRVDAERNIAEIASPVGVVFALIPKRVAFATQVSQTVA